MHNKTEMAIGFGFKWNISLSQDITRVITFRIDLLCLHLDNSELRLALSATTEHANTHINLKTPLMKIEKVVLRNEWRGIRSLSLRQFVSPFIPRPLWLTWATMCTYRVQTFNFFTPGTISTILSAFGNWKFKQSVTKMIARWMTWQDFPLKRKLYFPFDFEVRIWNLIVSVPDYCLSFYFVWSRILVEKVRIHSFWRDNQPYA